MIYLDNSATTKPCETAVKYINESLVNNWGNPSSLYSFGISAEETLNQTRTDVAKVIGANADEIFFTSGGTEANNMVIRGVAASRKKRGNRIVVSSIEHHCVLDTVKELENQGFDVVYLPVGNDGVVSENDIIKAVTKDTILVSIMLVNNETGAIQPINAARRAINLSGAPALLHTDAVQGFGKLPICVTKLGVDFLTASGHKIHGPKGVGILYKKKDVFLPPLITGGGQEKNLRSGTEAVPAISGLLGAIKELDIKNDYLHAKELNSYAKEILGDIDSVQFNSPDNALPYIINISVPGYRSETLLHFLEADGICVSSGSACSKGKGSYVLSSMGYDRQRVDSALRISFSRYNSKEDIDALATSLLKAKERLRKSE